MLGGRPQSEYRSFEPLPALWFYFIPVPVRGMTARMGYKTVRIMHPACSALIFALPAFPYPPTAGTETKTPVYGVDHRLVLDGCRILTNFYAADQGDHYLSKDHAGHNRVAPRSDDVLPPGKYFYHPAPPTYDQNELSDRHGLHGVEVSGTHSRPLETTDGLPRGCSWAHTNTNLDDPANGITLRADLGECFESHGWVFYPDGQGRLMTYVCLPYVDFAELLHRRLVTLSRRVSDEFLYARFAYAMIKLVDSASARLKRFRNPDGIRPAKEEGFRGLLFYASRRYLLRHLYHDLQDLSSPTSKAASSSGPGTPAIVFDASETELGTLPTPSSASFPPNGGVRKRPFHSALSRALFSLCFTESCTLFLLLICQALELFHPRVRLFNWQVSLTILVVAIVLVIPLSYSLVLSNRSSTAGVPVTPTRPRTSSILNIRLALYLIPNFLFLLALSYVPLPAGMPAHSVAVATLSRLTVIGTVILGALSGFGAIDTAWDFFPVFSRHGPARTHPTDEEVRIAEAGLQRVREDLARRQKDLQNLEAAKKPDTQSSWLYRALPSFQGSESSALAQEIAGLQTLEYEMGRSLDALKQRQADAKFARTVAGRVFTWGGRVFAAYCVYRILSCTVNLILPRARPSEPGMTQGSTSADAVSLVLAYALSFLPFVSLPQDRVAVLSRQISLALVGAIILSSIRRVLRGVAGLLRVTSRSLGASLMLLTLAQVMGIYLLSTLIQLRTSFPPPPPGTEPDVGADGATTTPTTTTNLFTTLPEYQFFGALFDGAFLLAAGASAAVRWFGDRMSA
ncbi:transporter [Ganoderma sinense ZZ0214-1]|uniref:Transporter n=1 Tax=Ganoderma sinense ZZ0214-1 TaxID=1077348 RepID=A0A2G8RWC5_9APHY|nr:transporter [Ganoderma sinense ZZ0214-1]